MNSKTEWGANNGIPRITIQDTRPQTTSPEPDPTGDDPEVSQKCPQRAEQGPNINDKRPRTMAPENPPPKAIIKSFFPIQNPRILSAAEQGMEATVRPRLKISQVQQVHMKMAKSWMT